LIGNSAVNVLTGGAGDDLYIIQTPGDTVVELPGGGMDNVQSSVSFVLPTNVEWLTLTGSAALSATGNDLPNMIFGNSGGDTIDGGGGADSMFGGNGDDTFIVDNALDNVDGAGGTDLVLSSASYSIGAGIENLTLTGTSDI